MAEVDDMQFLRTTIKARAMSALTMTMHRDKLSAADREEIAEDMASACFASLAPYIDNAAVQLAVAYVREHHPELHKSAGEP